jgi:hypothetical protein
MLGVLLSGRHSNAPPDTGHKAARVRMQSRCQEQFGPSLCEQVNDDGTLINDSLGHPNRTLVDNIDDVDTTLKELIVASSWVDLH